MMTTTRHLDIALQNLGLKQMPHQSWKEWPFFTEVGAVDVEVTHTPEPLHTRTGAACSKEIFRHMLPLVHVWSSTCSSIKHQNSH